MRFALIDPNQPEPQPVLGWYDTDIVQYSILPPKDSRILVPSEVWNERVSGYWQVRGGKFERGQPLCLRAGKLVPSGLKMESGYIRGVDLEGTQHESDLRPPHLSLHGRT